MEKMLLLDFRRDIWKGVDVQKERRYCNKRGTYRYGCFLKWWYPTTMDFPIKNDHFGVFWGYYHFRNPPYIYIYRATDSHLEYSKKIVRSSDTLRISKSLAVRIFPPSQNHSHLEYFFEKCKKPSVFNRNWGKTLALRILKKNILILT